MKTFKLTSQMPIFPVETKHEKGIYEVTVQCDDVADEYHTLHELYEHRMALNIALFNQWGKTNMYFNVHEINEAAGKIVCPVVMKSLKHHDGTMFGDYFIVMAITEFGQISYHYRLKHWNKFKYIPEVESTPEWDGHSSLQVMERLMLL
jgi:hypothetical protein